MIKITIQQNDKHTYPEALVAIESSEHIDIHEVQALWNMARNGGIERDVKHRLIALCQKKGIDVVSVFGATDQQQP